MNRCAHHHQHYAEVVQLVGRNHQRSYHLARNTVNRRDHLQLCQWLNNKPKTAKQ